MNGGSLAARSLGVRTLFRKEVKRFLRVPGQTVFSPLVTTTLYFIVFGFSLGSRLQEVEGVPYARFIVPGLVTLGVITNSFLNTASSMFIMKVQGTIVDLLVTPLSYIEILFAFVGTSVFRGVSVGVLTWLVAAAFTGFEVAHPVLALASLILVATAFGSLGLIIAIWAEKFEQVNFVPTFVITPLTFLGGVFYSISMLPASLRGLTLANPVFYMVDAVRYGILGIAETRPSIGLAILVALNFVTLAAAYTMLRSGYKLRG